MNNITSIVLFTILITAAITAIIIKVVINKKLKKYYEKHGGSPHIFSGESAVGSYQVISTVLGNIFVLVDWNNKELCRLCDLSKVRKTELMEKGKWYRIKQDTDGSLEVIPLEEWENGK